MVAGRSVHTSELRRNAAVSRKGAKAEGTGITACVCCKVTRSTKTQTLSCKSQAERARADSEAQATLENSFVFLYTAPTKAAAQKNMYDFLNSPAYVPID